MGKVVEEAWTLNSADEATFGVADSTTYRKDGTADKWSDIWLYQVPTGTAHILKPSHRFSCYLDKWASGAIDAGTARIKIVIRDQSQGDEKTIFGPALQEVCAEFQDADKMATLDLQSDISVEEMMWIVVQCYVVTTYHDESDSYFKLETVRIRSGL